MRLSGLIGAALLAMLEGALLVLPRANALERLAGACSPAWGALLPGSILLGTFGVRALPPMATGIVVVASVATPVLFGAAALIVVRGPRLAIVPLALALALVAEFIHGWTGNLFASVVTGLGSLTLGVAIVRLIPRRYMLISILGMCAVDVALLAVGAGEPAAAQISHAAASLHRPTFDDATIGPVTTDYPDLVLVGVLAGLITTRAVRWRAAALLTLLTAGYGVLLPLVGTLPATVPIAVTFVMVSTPRSWPPRLLPTSATTRFPDMNQALGTS
jgi:hypothetical protein